MATDDDIPKGSLPPKRKGAKPKPRKRAPAKARVPKGELPAKKRRPRKAPSAAKAPAFDAKAEAAAARASVAERSGKSKASVPIDPVIERAFPPKATKLPRLSAEKRAEVREEALRARETFDEKLRAKVGLEVTEEIFSDVCMYIASGMTLREIVRRDDMPSRWSIMKYMEAEDPDLQRSRFARYLRARRMGYDDLADEAMEIADDGSNDYMERMKDGASEMVIDREHIARSKLRFDARIKLLSLWDPQRYGDKMALTDPNGDPLGTGAAKERTVSDMAINLWQLFDAAKRERPALSEGQIIEGEAE